MYEYVLYCYTIVRMNVRTHTPESTHVVCMLDGLILTLKSKHHQKKPKLIIVCDKTGN